MTEVAVRMLNRGTMLKASGLTRAPYINNVDLTLNRGEVLGIAGLMGAGRTELMRPFSQLRNWTVATGDQPTSSRFLPVRL